MANPRKLDKRRKSVRNIRKITRTMELIATARFKKAMDRATAATAYTRRITQVVADLAQGGVEVNHPLLQPRPTVRNAVLLVLAGNRGLCGGYNSSAVRAGIMRHKEVGEEVENLRLEVSGKRAISGMNFRSLTVDESFTQFDDQPSFDEVEPIANRYLEGFISGEIDRVDVAYTKFHSVAKQEAIVETILPLGSLTDSNESDKEDDSAAGGESMYEFWPSAESILEEVVPASFRVRLFKCFLDAAVSEQVSRMVAMKSATENADEMIRLLSRNYNRARQSRITGEIMEVLGGVEAMK